MAKKKVNKNTWGLVRMDGTSKLQWELKRERKVVTGDKYRSNNDINK